MALSPSQDERLIQLTTPLGKDVLNAIRFDGTEGLSELFEFTVEALGKKEPVVFDSAIGANCTVTVAGKTAGRRPFCGVLVRADWLGEEHDLYLYRLVLRPWLWLLGKVADCRIFHKQSTPDIIRTVFGDRGFSDFELKLSENYPKREYCVQYRETDLDFVCRLMEEDGIYYFFRHEDGKHTLVLVDAKSGHSPISGLDKLFYAPRLARERTDRESLFGLSVGRRFQSGKVVLNDYDYTKPRAAMLGQYQKKPNHVLGTLEVYDYPGRYTEASPVGDRRARVRLEAEQAADERREGLGDAAALYPGGLVTLENHPERKQNIEYLVVRCVHRCAKQAYRSGTAGQADEPYQGIYALQPSDRPFRAPLVTAKPRIHGPQTAKVIGKKGEEIDVDEQGRILVQFHWDRNGDGSCRVRVAQTWSGSKWGTVVIPRIGQEVVVEHLEGDPDRPLVTGTVYNADREVPYTLPAEKTKAGLKSNSTKGGGGYNELVFDDEKDKEKIGLHAQKDLEVTVLNSETRTIGEKFKSGTSRETKLEKGDDKLTVASGGQTVDIKKDQDVDIKGNQNTKVGQKVVIEAGTSLELVCGGSKIKITPTEISIEAAATVKVKASGQAEINGGAMLKQSAGIIKLN